MGVSAVARGRCCSPPPPCIEKGRRYGIQHEDSQVDSSRDFLVGKKGLILRGLCLVRNCPRAQEWGPVGKRPGDLLTILLSPHPQEALPGLIWDLGQQLGDLSLESGGLEQESGRSSGESRGQGGGQGTGPSWDTPILTLGFCLRHSRSPLLTASASPRLLRRPRLHGRCRLSHIHLLWGQWLLRLQLLRALGALRAPGHLCQREAQVPR